MRRVLLDITRIWVPLVIAIAGVVLIIDGHARSNSVPAAAGVALVVVAVTVWLLNWLYRLGVQSAEDRDREERAREYFDEHGKWPDE
jgi:membrane protein YdbS with pleckstrin-like domain